MCFQIPLIAKMDFHLGRFVLQPLAGFYLNFGFAKEYGYYIDNAYFSDDADDYTTPLVGWMLGGTAGFRLGRGFLFTELRYLSDFHGAEDAEGHKWYRRAAALFSLGYQYYFKQK
jgi:hypothetical protein